MDIFMAMTVSLCVCRKTAENDKKYRYADFFEGE